MKPAILLVDVDGVINCFGNNTPHTDWEHHFIYGGLDGQGTQGFTIRIPHGTSERFRRLSEHFELIWGTGWMHDAHPAFGELLKLGPDWEVVDVSKGFINASYERDADSRNAQALSWKLPSIKLWAQKNALERPLAWIDDDIYRDAFEWASERDENEAPTKIVKTECHIGMTDKHVDDLIHWVEEEI